MESNSDLSSHNSLHHEETAIPSIHVQEFILQQHAKNISSMHQSLKKKNFPHIFTVAQTLKDPIILNHIKPDYGSLGEFIGDINIGRDLLNQKKRKNQYNQEQLQQKKLRSVLEKKNQDQLKNLYLNKSSSSLIKKMSGKLMVQNLFKDQFGMTLNTFETQNTKSQPVKSGKINFETIQDIFSGKYSLAKNMQLINDKKTMKVGGKNVEQQKSQGRKKQYRKLSQKQKIEVLSQLKSKYSSLKRIQFKKQCQQFNRLSKKQKEQIQNNSSYRPQTSIETKEPVHTLIISQKQIIIQKVSIKSDLLLFILSSFDISRVQSIVLSHLRISQDQLCFFLDAVRSLCQGLTILTISSISLEKTQNFATRLKELLEVSAIKQLNLQYLDIQTKQFCLICLGIGSNRTLQLITFDNNGIDERACKSLQLITKHCSNLKKISLKKNYLQPHHFSYFSVQCKSKIMI